MQMPNPALPLQRYQLFQSTELDEARERVAAVFCPHRLETIGPAPLAARQHRLAGERLSLNYIEYGAKTLISPGELGDFYLLQIPISGGAAIRNGAQNFISTPGRAAILNPHVATTMIWEQGTRQILVQINRQALQDHVQALCGVAVAAPITFQGTLDTTTGAGAALQHLVMFLVNEADQGLATIAAGGLLSRQMEATVLSGLLEAAHHDQAEELRLRNGPVRPRHVKLAEDFILANLDQPIEIADIAAAAGVSIRALQMGFRRFRDTTPLKFLTSLRIARAHADLMSGTAGISVTTAAARWGFTHFGRFSEIYRARFGLRPIDTLRAARRHGYQD